MTEQTEQINQELTNMGLTLTAEFVPFSRSRNAKKDPKINDYSINWIVTIQRNNKTLTTDYMQGIGHLPENIGSVFGTVTIDQAKNIKTACETGKYFPGGGQFIQKALKQPSLTDVIWSLSLDSDVLNYGSFEDWASEFGYDADSRQAEKIYNECMKIALKFKQLFTGAEIEKLHELYQDY